MTQKEFNQEFKTLFAEWKKYTLTDRRLYYNDMIEQYRRGGQITEKQAQKWGHPDFLTAWKSKIHAGSY